MTRKVFRIIQHCGNEECHPDPGAALAGSGMSCSERMIKPKSIIYRGQSDSVRHLQSL